MQKAADILEELSLAGVNLDEGMLFLAQTAYRSIGNFFSLASTNKIKSSVTANSLQSQYIATQQQLQQHHQHVSKRHNNQAQHGSSDIDPTSYYGLANGMKNSISGVVAVSSVGASSGLKEVTEFESELAKNLVQFQDQLLRTKLRLDVMEMVQVSIGYLFVGLWVTIMNIFDVS
jgi:hypothetical protein